MSTQLDQIAGKAKSEPKLRFTSLAHLLTPEFLKETWKQMNRRGASGIDGETTKEFEQDLDTRVQDLCERLKQGAYRAPPVRRVEIPKGPGKVGTRPLGIPTVEDRLLQRAVARILEAVFEADFLECSYGFRPGRSPHDALRALRGIVFTKKVGHLYEADTLRVDPGSNYLRRVRHAMRRCDSPPTSATWGARCGNSARRVLRGGTGTRGQASRPVSTHQIMRKRARFEQDAGEIDEEMGNTRTAKGGKPYSAGQDRTAHGLNGHTYGRVTLYCCPHDQVISATTVQGIGWRGLSAEEIEKTGGHGVFTQRVFASGYTVGQELGGEYDYWKSDWRASVNQEKGFWYPASPQAKFGLSRALRANDQPFGQIGTLTSAPLLYLATLLIKLPVNADPPAQWTVPVTAPKLDEPFEPVALRYGKPVEVEVDGLVSRFNESYDPPSAARNTGKASADAKADDPYDSFVPKASDIKGKPVTLTDMEAQGTRESEAAQRYEDHATLRQEARRDAQHGFQMGWVDADGKVRGEDDLANAPDGYRDWHNGQINKILSGGVTNNPTNHSTTMTHPMHAEKALAYDVAIGLCYLSEDDWWKLRIEADWRFGDGMDKSNPNKRYAKYFADGVMGDVPDEHGVKGDRPLDVWVRTDPEAALPDKIRDQREGDLFLKFGEAV